MSANWSFFLLSGLKRTIFLYRNSVKRSRHNVWTLCINLIELQLFCDDFGEHQTSKSRRNDHTSSDSFFSFSLSHIFDSCTHIWIGISNSCSGPIGKLCERARDLFDLASHSIFFWRPHTNTHSDRRAVSYNVHYYSIENEFFNSAKLIQKFARFNNEQQLHERERAKKCVSYSYIAFGYFVVWEHYRCELVEIQNDETTEKMLKSHKFILISLIFMILLFSR